MNKASPLIIKYILNTEVPTYFPIIYKANHIILNLRGKLANQMYTPKLKRNQQSVFSTIDQTISNSFKVHSQRNTSKEPPLHSFKLDGNS